MAHWFTINFSGLTNINIKDVRIFKLKFRSISLLLLAEVAAMSLWFVSAAILPEMVRETDVSSIRQAALSSGVQAGFVIGALLSAVLGLADRYDPRRVFAISAVGAGLANLILLIASPGSALAIAARVVTGALLAGVYPVGMKIAVGWGDKDRGFLVGALVGALTLGSAAPHLIALGGGSDLRLTVVIASVGAIIAGIL
jgi:sugar phosphate permease